MRFAEVILRLAVGLVSWMFLYAHFLWLAALRSIGCAVDGAEMHALLMGIAPLTIAAAFMLRLTRPLGDVHRILRWLSVPLFLILPLVLLSIWEILDRVHLQSLVVCEAGSAATWHQYWTTVQLLTVLTVTLLLLRNWQLNLREAGDRSRAQL